MSQQVKVDTKSAGIFSQPHQVFSESTALAAVMGKKQIKWVVLQNPRGLDVFSQRLI